MSSEFHYYIRAKFYDYEEINIKFETNKFNKTLNFRIMVCEYTNYPEAKNVYLDYIPTGTRCYQLIYNKDIQDPFYDIYIANIAQWDNNSTYFTIDITCFNPGQKYFSITMIPKENGNSSDVTSDTVSDIVSDYITDIESDSISDSGNNLRNFRINKKLYILICILLFKLF